MFYIRRFLFSIMALMPFIANAQQQMSDYTPASSSKAQAILGSLFGKLGTFGADGGDPFISVITYFNGACLFIGGALVMYTIFAGTLATAHDGEMLGKKFSSVWMPIRTAMGTALVLPVINGGYCTIQLILGSVISMSIGLADQTWTKFVSSDNLGNALTVGLIRQDTKQLGYTVLQNYVCLQVMSKVTKEADPVIGGANSTFSISKEVNGDNTIYKFGDINSTNAFKQDSCGSITVPTKQEVIEYPLATGLWKNQNNYADATARMQRIMNTHITQLTSMMGQMQSQADSLVGGATLNPATIDQIISTYELAVRNEATQEILSIDAFKDISSNASQDGFVGMAFFYTKMNFLSDLIYRSMAKVPTANPPNLNVAALYQDQYMKYYASLMETIAKTKRGQAFGPSFEKGGSNNQVAASSWTDYLSPSFDFSNALKSMFTDGRTSIVLQQGEHPIMASKRLGNTMLGIASSGYIAGTLALATVGNAPGIGLAIIGSLMLFVPLLATAGFVLSYVIPFTPTVLIISALVGWVIMCIEAILIAPLWAVMHLHGEGDTMVGSGAQGYRLVLSLMLKPVLIVFAVVTSISLLPIFGDLISSTFQDTFMALTEETNIFMVVLSMVASTLIYGGLVYHVVKRIFNIIVELPDSVLKWITSSDQTLGSSAQQINGGTFQGAGAIVNNVGGQGASSIRQDLKNKGNNKGLKNEPIKGGMEKNGKDMPMEPSGGGNSATNENSLSKVMPTSGQLNLMNKLSEKHGVPITEDDKATKQSVSKWLSETTKQFEPEKYKAQKEKQ